MSKPTRPFPLLPLQNQGCLASLVAWLADSKVMPGYFCFETCCWLFPFIHLVIHICFTLQPLSSGVSHWVATLWWVWTSDVCKVKMWLWLCLRGFNLCFYAFMLHKRPFPHAASINRCWILSLISWNYIIKTSDRPEKGGWTISQM